VQGGHSCGKPGKVREFDHDWRVATLTVLYFLEMFLAIAGSFNSSDWGFPF